MSTTTDSVGKQSHRIWNKSFLSQQITLDDSLTYIINHSLSFPAKGFILNRITLIRILYFLPLSLVIRSKTRRKREQLNPVMNLGVMTVHQQQQQKLCKGDTLCGKTTTTSATAAAAADTVTVSARSLRSSSQSHLTQLRPHRLLHCPPDLYCPCLSHTYHSCCHTGCYTVHQIVTLLVSLSLNDNTHFHKADKHRVDRRP